MVGKPNHNVKTAPLIPAPEFSRVIIYCVGPMYMMYAMPKI